MSLEPSPSTGPLTSPSPILSTKFSSIDPGPSESSNSSFRKSWGSRSRERQETPDGDGGIRESLQHQQNDEPHHSVRQKLSKPRDSGGFLIHNPLGGSKKKRNSRASRNVSGTGNRRTHKVGDGQEDPNGMDGEPQDGTTQDKMMEDVKDGKGKSRISSSSLAPLATLGPNSSAGPAPEPIDAEHLHPHVEVSNAQSSIDPSQIVRMALNLNESRRMSLSPGQLAPTGSPGGKRVTSTGQIAMGPVIQSSLRGPSGSLKSSLRSQPAGRESVSPSGSKSESHQSRDVSQSSSPQPPLIQQTAAQQPLVFDLENPYDHSFSPATLARAEKARKFIELAHEYRRLLPNLPPLKPQIAQSQDPRRDLSNAQPITEPRQLGRAYNPLQYIRNRRVRAREREMFDAEAAGWNNVENVRNWVDNVEVQATQPGFQIDDVAVLPQWLQPMRKMSAQEDPETRSPAATSNKQKKYKLDWSFDPTDLLADAYWLEEGAHKALIESRDGDHIFDNFKRPKRARISADVQRQSYDPGDQPARSSFSSPQSPMDLDTQSATSGTDDFETVKTSSVAEMSRNESRTARVKRRLLGRRHKEYNSDSNLDESDDEVSLSLKKKRKRTAENTGPLEKHMNKILADESRHHGFFSFRASSPTHDDPNARRGGVSEHKKQEPPFSPISEANTAEERSFHWSPGTDDNSPVHTPRISMGDVDRNDVSTSNGDINHNQSPSKGYEGGGSLFQRMHKPRANSRNFLWRHRAKDRDQIEETDFAQRHHEESEPSSPQSPEINSPRSSNDIFSDRSRRGSDKDRKEMVKEGGDGGQDQTATSTTRRFFKSGRIGEIVRSEKGLGNDNGSKRRPPTSDSKSPLRDAVASDSSDDESIKPFVSATDQSHRRSLSTDAVPQANYHIKNLPSFVSSSVNKTDDKERPSTGDDHISRQQLAQREQKRQSRFERFAPPRIQTPEISPNNSSTEISRYSTRNDKRPRSTSGLERSPKASRSTSRSGSAVRAADKRLNAILREPGGVGKGGLPVTGLAGLEPQRRVPTNKDSDHHSWNIAQGSNPPSKADAVPVVTYKEIAYVKALLLSSGIKARGIATMADEAPKETQGYLADAARTANVQIPKPVARRQGHVVAARMLNSHLESNVSSLQQAVDQFRNQTCRKLQSRIDDLGATLRSKLTPVVRSCSDDADGFIAGLTTTHTLAVKQVNDGVTQMWRERRRRLRWLSRTGFTLLEWVLVGLMWWIWLFVYAFKTIRALVMGVYYFVKWLLWL